ncbi:MAG: hypothetical protein ACI9BD_000194 [Candidatus Marinamargulisbacteria bacterium]|jgi:hypothetical protein
MKKFTMFTAMAALMFAMVSTPAAMHTGELEFTVPVVGGVGGPLNGARAYCDITEDIDVVLALSAVVPGTKTAELDVDFSLGIRTELPLVGETEILANFDKYDGATRATATKWGTATGTQLHLYSLSVSRTWLFKLADQIDLGVRCDFAEIMLDGSKVVKVHGALVPVIGVTISM